MGNTYNIPVRGTIHPDPTEVSQWVQLGNRIWQDRLLTYGTKPLPDYLGIDDENTGEPVLDAASHELSEDHETPVRFLTARQCKEEEDRKYADLKPNAYVESWPRVRCCFMRSPSTQQVVSAVTRHQDERLESLMCHARKLVRIIVTISSVFIGSHAFKDCNGFARNLDPRKEYDIMILNNDADDDTILWGGRRATRIYLTFDGNENPPVRFGIPYRGTFCELINYGSMHKTFDVSNEPVCVRLHDGDGRLLCVNTVPRTDLFEYRFNERIEHPAGTHFLQKWENRSPFTPLVIPLNQQTNAK